MIIAVILGVVVFVLSKSIIGAVCTFYFITGIWKTLLWTNIKYSRMADVFLPPVLKKTIWLGIILWPIILLNGDPIKSYNREIREGRIDPPKNKGPYGF